MNQTFRSGIAILAAIIVVSGGIYLIDKHSGWRPFASSTPISEIKGSAGIVSPTEIGGGQSDLPFENKGAAIGTKQGRIFRCDVDGKTTYADAPCDGSRSRVIEIKQSAGIQVADPWEVEKFRLQALAPKVIAEQERVPSVRSKVSSGRARCDELEKRVKYLDDYGRHPLSASRQNQIRGERKETRDEMFAFDCMDA